MEDDSHPILHWWNLSKLFCRQFSVLCVSQTYCFPRLSVAFRGLVNVLLHAMYMHDSSCNTSSTENPVGGALPDKKGGATFHKFWKEPLTGAKILFCECGVNLFSKTTHYLLSYFFPAQNTLKGTAKLWLWTCWCWTLYDVPNCFFPLKETTNTLVVFTWKFPPVSKR